MMSGPTSIREVFKMPEFFLALAAIIIGIVGGIALVYGNLLGITTVLTGLVMGATSAVSMGYLKTALLKEILSLKTISSVLGFLHFFNSLIILASAGVGAWTGWMTLVSSLLSLYAAYLVLFRKKEVMAPPIVATKPL